MYLSFQVCPQMLCAELALALAVAVASVRPVLLLSAELGPLQGREEQG
jgi:hypothetical protein